MKTDLLEKKELINQYLKETNRYLSSFSFVSIFSWKDFFDFDLKIIDRNLCIFAQDSLGTFLYLPPLGKEVVPETIKACFEYMEKANKGKGVTRIENIPEQERHLFPESKFSHYRKGYEYCYFKNDIVNLRGNPYKTKRSSYNFFTKQYNCVYCSYEKQMLDECLDLYAGWAKDRQNKNEEAIYSQMIQENYKVHRLVLEHYKELDLVGRVVKVQNKIKAYTFGFEISKDIFCVLFEITDLAIKGLSVFIFKEFCQDSALAQYKFINVMDDFELKNIERTKMSFHPTILFPAYVVKKKVV